MGGLGTRLDSAFLLSWVVTLCFSRPQQEKEKETEEEEGEEEKDISGEDEGQKGMKFEEKQLPSEETTPGSFKGFAFKKRTGGAQKRPQIRERTSQI